MKIKTLILKNFRAYKDVKVNFDESMNVIIGQNDVGKSTILEALDIFFGGEVIKIDISDFNKNAQDNKILIGVEFVVDPEERIIIDASNPTNLRDEFLLNENRCLEILKEFEVRDEKLQKEKIYINSYYPNLFDTPLVTKKITELRTLLRNKTSEEVVADTNQNKSADIRKALYKNLILDETPFENMLIDVAKEDAKTIWGQFEKWLPLYFLLQSDRVNKDSDADIQNPLKSATKTIVADFEDRFEEIKQELQDRLVEVGNETIEKMRDMGLDIANNLKPKIISKNLDSLFSFSLESDDGIALNKRGSGFRRMVILNYFRAEADRKIAIEENRNKNIIYAIEEPETAQHPNHQKMLIEALMELSKKDNYQIIITTHTPEIAKMVSENNLILVKRLEQNTCIDTSTDKLNLIAQALGIHPYFRHKVVVCVEGEFDRMFLLNINTCIEEYKNIINLKEEQIDIIPLQGGNLKSWVNRNYLKNSNIIEFHIYDSDRGAGKNEDQYSEQINRINARNNGSCAIITQKREMENYIHRSLIEGEFEINLGDIDEYDIEDIPQNISNKKHMKEECVKEILNGKLSRLLTKEMLEEMNAFEEIKGWFEKIRDLSRYA